MKRELENFMKDAERFWGFEPIEPDPNFKGMTTKGNENIPELVELLKTLHKENRMKFHKSPYGYSFYLTKRGEKIEWGHKPEGSYRLSDHWGWEQEKFGGEVIIHCPIDGNEEDKATWHLCRWENGVYKIVK